MVPVSGLLRRAVSFAVALFILSISLFSSETRAEAYTYKAPYKVKVLDSSNTGASGEVPKNIFDGNRRTKWYTTDLYSIGGRSFGQAYIVFKLSKPIVLKDYVISTGNSADDGNLGRCPKSWTLYGSSKKLGKDESGWKLVDKVDGDTRIENVNYRSYSYVPSATNVSYQYYKLVIRETNGFSLEDLANDPLNGLQYYTSQIGMQISGFDLRGKVAKK